MSKISMNDDKTNLLRYYYDCIFIDSSSESISAEKNRAFTIEDDVTQRKDRKLNELEISKFNELKIKQHKTSKYWYGYLLFYDAKFKVYRPLLYGLINTDNHYVEDSNPKLNASIFKSELGLSNEEIKKISERLEIENDECETSYSAILNKLIEIDEAFKAWVEKNQSNAEHPLIFRGAIIASESSRYTDSLDKEYSDIIRLLSNENHCFERTSFDLLFETNEIKKETHQEHTNELFFFEPFKIDEQQRIAVESSLRNPITIITGPPGTGKSQVVSTIIMNAVLNNQSVLFASKNNQAIDVVNNRVNSFFKNSYPFIINLKNTELIQWLKQILLFKFEPEKTKELKHYVKRIDELYTEKESIQSTIERVSQIRSKFNILVNKPDKTINQKFLSKIKNDRCIKSALLLNKAYRTTANYLNLLTLVQKIDNIEELSEQLYSIQERINEVNIEFIKHWHRLYPSFIINNEDKKTLSAFISIKEQLSSSGRISTSDYIHFQNQLKEITPKVTKCIRAWSITNLSTYRRIALAPNIFDLVIIDEASQNDIASAIPLLLRSKRAVIIGDPNQLTHISSISTYESRKYMTKHCLTKKAKWSNFEYTVNSLYSLFAGLYPENIIMLKDHYRSHQHIIEFSNKEWYHGKLEVSTDYRKFKLECSSGNEKHVEWIDVKGRILQSNGSYFNNEEVNATVSKALEVYNNNKLLDIGVVTPYREQANRIRLALRNKADKNQTANDTEKIISETIHRYQGEEKDIMLFSLIVSDQTVKKESINRILNFYKDQSNLINVALTRARQKLFIIGDKEFCSACGLDILERLSQYYDNLNEKPHTSLFESDEEKFFYAKMAEHGLDAIPQYCFNQYRLDFAIIDENSDIKLCIEVDGKQHKKGFMKDTDSNIKYDIIRNQRLHYYGWKVLRFWTYEIRDNAEVCIAKIKRALNYI